MALSQGFLKFGLQSARILGCASHNALRYKSYVNVSGMFDVDFPSSRFSETKPIAIQQSSSVFAEKISEPHRVFHILGEPWPSSRFSSWEAHCFDVDVDVGVDTDFPSSRLTSTTPRDSVFSFDDSDQNHKEIVSPNVVFSALGEPWPSSRIPVIYSSQTQETITKPLKESSVIYPVTNDSKKDAVSAHETSTGTNRHERVYGKLHPWVNHSEKS